MEGRRLRRDDASELDAVRVPAQLSLDPVVAFWAEVGLDPADLGSLDRNYAYLAWVIARLRQHGATCEAARHVVAHLALPIARALHDNFRYREDEFGFYLLAYQMAESARIRRRAWPGG